MKNFLILLAIITIFLSVSDTYGYKKTYLQDTSSINYGLNRYNYSNYNNYRYYNPYISSYRYKTLNSDDKKRLRRMRLIRNMQRMQRNYLYGNFLTWNNQKNPKDGILTGYSVPVDSDDIYYDYNSGKKVKNYNQNAILKPSSNCNTDLYSMPTRDNSHYSNGRKVNDGGGVAGKTGVSIIWD